MFAVVGTVLGVSAHHLVTDGPVPWRQSGAAAAVLFALGLLGAQRPRSLTAVVTTCGATQAGLHLWLMTQRPGGTAPVVMPGHTHRVAGAPGARHERLHDSLAMTAAHASLAMTALHALAAVLVAVLLHRADAACWALARGLTTAIDVVRRHIGTAWELLTLRAAWAAEAGLPLLRTWEERLSWQGTALADVVVRRGPPRAGLSRPF